MNTIFVKILDDGRVIEAPKNYKNISNFNKVPSLMKREGFVERINKLLSEMNKDIILHNKNVTKKEQKQFPTDRPAFGICLLSF